MKVNGHPLKCPHCGGTSFTQGSAQLNTPGMTFFGLDWLNQEAATFLCQTCGRIEWFVEVEAPPRPRPEIEREVEVSNEVTEPPKTTEQLLQEDPDFLAWQERNPEVKERAFVDQIALYRDYQQGRS